MAGIDMVLSLEDRFTSVFQRFVQGADAAISALDAVDRAAGGNGVAQSLRAQVDAALAQMSRLGDAARADPARNAINSYTRLAAEAGAAYQRINSMAAASGNSATRAAAQAAARAQLALQQSAQQASAAMERAQRAAEEAAAAEARAFAAAGTESAAALEAAARAAREAADEAQREADEAARRTENARAEAERLTRQLDDVGDSARRGAGGVDALTSPVKSLAASYLSLQTVKKAVEISDSYVSMAARIDAVNDGLQSSERLNNAIFQAAQRSRGSYAETANLVAQLGNNARDAFSSSREIVAFAEQLNKQLTLSGASGASASAAIVQLTQGLASGTLRGDELNSVLEQAPGIAKTIAEYMGLSTGQLRSVAAEGKITAQVVKNAMFDAAERTDAAFANMPITFSQAAQIVRDRLYQDFSGVWEMINSGVNIVAKNLDSLVPILEGLAVSIGVATAAWAAYKIQAGVAAFASAAAALALKTTTIEALKASGAIKGLSAAILANPIGLLVGAAAAAAGVALGAWIRKVGGVKIAWLIAADAVLTTLDKLKIAWKMAETVIIMVFNRIEIAIDRFGEGIRNFSANAKIVFETVKNAVLDFGGKIKIGLQTAFNAAADIVGNLWVDIQSITQNGINAAIDLINKFINTLNKIPGVNLDIISRVTFADNAAQKALSAQAERAAALANAKSEYTEDSASRQAAIDTAREENDAIHAANAAAIDSKERLFKNDAYARILTASEMLKTANAAHGERLMNINLAKMEAEDSGGDEFDYLSALEKNTGALEQIAGGVSSINRSVSATDEELKMMVDMAQQKYVNNINLTSQTPVINITGQNTGDAERDRRALAETLKNMLLEQVAESSYVSTAMQF